MGSELEQQLKSVLGSHAGDSITLSSAVPGMALLVAVHERLKAESKAFSQDLIRNAQGWIDLCEEKRSASAQSSGTNPKVR